MRKGFTLIEVLVSLVILSMIAVISSNILQSSLETEFNSSERLHSARKLNFSSITLRRDIRQIINVPLRDFYGNQIKGTFIGNNIDNKIAFNTKIKSISNEISPIKRVEYVFEENNLVRKQFYSSNPYDAEEFIKSVLIEEVSEIDIRFLHEKMWYQEWPVDPITQRKIPELIKLEFTKNNKEYTWIIEPNFDYVFKY
tara:strand:+ start:6141 stop:6734 length:594 start_codon:yes stop_codon:yes gene_type:complete